MKSPYFRYFVPSPDKETWGIEVTACGRLDTRPGEDYPPTGHPGGHHFEWESGRVLEALQIVLICRGGGRLEFRRGAARRIEAGSAFLLVPGVWHRYRPERESGWEESWVELRGPVVERFLGSIEVAKGNFVKGHALLSGLDLALDRVHAIAANARPSFNPELAAAGMGVLANWVAASPTLPLSPLKQAVMIAESELVERHAGSPDLEELARRLGVSYSHLRRAFKAHTGFSPWQYVLQVRLLRARRLLASGDETLQAIADEVGFGSPFHFSAAFKKAYGESPDRWRKRIRRDASRD